MARAGPPFVRLVWHIMVYFNTGFKTGIPVLARPNTEKPVLEKAGGIGIPNSGFLQVLLPVFPVFFHVNVDAKYDVCGK